MDREGEEVPAASAAEIREQRRRLERRLRWLMLAAVAAPIIAVLLFAVVLSGARGNLAGGLSVVLALLAAAIGTVLTVAIPVLVLGGVGLAIYWTYYRRPRPEADVAAPLRVSRREGSPAPWGPVAPASPDAVPADLAGSVALLETMRAEAARTTSLRTWTIVPGAVAVVVTLWFATGMGQGGKGSPALGFLVLVGLTATFAWLGANHGPRSRYAKAFKAELMPRLLRPHGSLRFVAFEMPPVDRMVATGCLPTHDKARGEDGIEGVLDGCRVRIGEVELSRRGSKGSHNRCFRGLLVELKPGGRLPGTVVVLDAHAPVDLLSRRGPDLPRFDTADARFEAVYRAFASDLAAGRAFLTPIAQAALATIADETAFDPPSVLAEGSTAWFALRRVDGRDLFEPPSFSSHDAAQQLATQARDVGDVLRLVGVAVSVLNASAGSPTAASPPRPDPSA